MLEAVRRGCRTVNSLAARLGVTDNAVRGHLTALQRAGLVRSAGVVRSGVAGQPATEYELTPAADVTLSRAYAPVLGALVEALACRLQPRALRAMFTDAGRRLGPATRARASLASGARAARAILSALGASVHLERGESHVDLRGDGCPLAAAVARVPATCTIVAALLERQTGRPVEKRCTYSHRPRCAFRLS